MRYIKIGLFIFLIIVFMDLLLFGMSFVHHLTTDFVIFIFVFLLIILMISDTKLKYIKIGDESISYKKRKIAFADIHQLFFMKLFNRGSLTINPNKKSFFMLQYIPLDKFEEIKELLISKAPDAKIKYRNKYMFLGIFNFPIMITLFFIYTLFLPISLKPVDFANNSSLDLNLMTAHYQFYIDDVEYEGELTDTTQYVLTSNGIIRFTEYMVEGTSLRYSFQKLFCKPENDYSLIEYFFTNDFGAVIRGLKYDIIKDSRVGLFESAEFKVVSASWSENIRQLRIKKKDETGFLKIVFHFDISDNSILDILTSLSYSD